MAASDDPEQLLSRTLNLLVAEGVLQPRGPVVNFRHPQQLQDSVPLDLGSAAETEEQLLELCRKIIYYSVKTGHKNFHNQLYAGTDIYGLAGAWISEALNTNQHTYEVSPTFTLVEHAVLSHILKIIGFPKGDGIFSPGGSISNMYGMVLARYKVIPDVKKIGLFGSKPLVGFTSEEAHYSILKAAHWLGLGTDNIIIVKTNDKGQMIPENLEKCIQAAKNEGKLPFFVNATSGTTVLGAFDPLDKIADICLKHKLWLHVDACWGGSLMLSEKHSTVLNGIHRCDSVSWNPHKMLGAPLQCSVFVVKEQGLLHHCNSSSATYLFQQDKFYDTSFDTGDKSIQCGRKTDAFKLWVMWKARGDKGFENLVNNAMKCAMYFKKQILCKKGFRLVIPEFECTNICFWFIPPSLREKEETEEWWDKIHTVAPKIKESLMISGSLMIGYQPLKHKGLRNFFRVVMTCHPPPTFEDMDSIIKEIEHHGSKL